MTTIAYRDGVMAADSGSWTGGTVHRWASKLAVGPDGTLYGACGDAAECNAYLKWVNGGCCGESPKPRHLADRASFTVLIAPRGAPIRLLVASGEEIFDAPYMAIGGGSDAAMGALFVGASAQHAIQAAIEHTDYAHGDVNIVCHPTKGDHQ